MPDDEAMLLTAGAGADADAVHETAVEPLWQV